MLLFYVPQLHPTLGAPKKLLYWLIKYLFKEFALGDPQENRDLYDLLFYTHFLYAHGTRGSGVGASAVPNFDGVFGHPKIVLEKAAHSLFAKFPSAKLHYIELIGDDFEHVNKWISRTESYRLECRTTNRTGRGFLGGLRTRIL